MDGGREGARETERERQRERARERRGGSKDFAQTESLVPESLEHLNQNRNTKPYTLHPTPNTLIAQVAIASRRLDVAASPYDASKYLLLPIPIETLEGRVEYKV